MRTVYVSEYPAIQHRHGNGDIVTVRLKRREGEWRRDAAALIAAAPER